MSIILIAIFCFFEYFPGSVLYWAIRDGGKSLIINKRDMIITPLVFILPIKTIICIVHGIGLLINKYNYLPSANEEKIILKEKAQRQNGNLSIAENNDTGGLSVV